MQKQQVGKTKIIIQMTEDIQSSISSNCFDQIEYSITKKSQDSEIFNNKTSSLNLKQNREEKNKKIHKRTKKSTKTHQQTKSQDTTEGYFQNQKQYYKYLFEKIYIQKQSYEKVISVLLNMQEREISNRQQCLNIFIETMIKSVNSYNETIKLYGAGILKQTELNIENVQLEDFEKHKDKLIDIFSMIYTNFVEIKNKNKEALQLLRYFALENDAINKSELVKKDNLNQQFFKRLIQDNPYLKAIYDIVQRLKQQDYDEQHFKNIKFILQCGRIKKKSNKKNKNKKKMSQQLQDVKQQQGQVVCQQRQMQINSEQDGQFQNLLKHLSELKLEKNLIKCEIDPKFIQQLESKYQIKYIEQTNKQI